MRQVLLVGGTAIFATTPTAAQPPAARLVSSTVSTDLLLTGSKEPI